MWDWISTKVFGLLFWMQNSTVTINQNATIINGKEFVNSSLIFQYIGSIHYIAGDVIWYEFISILSLSVGFTIARLVVAILRIIRDIKQTLLF
jgi:hypothetical protein